MTAMEEAWEAGYKQGYQPPRYPVPAIPLLVRWQGRVWPNVVIYTPYSAPIRNQFVRIWKEGIE